jgi:hypothetical protein
MDSQKRVAQNNTFSDMSQSMKSYQPRKKKKKKIPGRKHSLGTHSQGCVKKVNVMANLGLSQKGLICRVRRGVIIFAQDILATTEALCPFPGAK